MKLFKTLIFSLLFTASFGLTAQTASVNLDKSNIEWKGTKIGGSHNGTIDLKSGSLTLKNGEIMDGSFVIDMTSIINLDVEDPGYNKKLVDHLKSDDFFGVSSYPEARFEITESSSFKNGKANVKGKLTLKGKTGMLAFDVVKSNNSYKASIEVDRSEYDVRYGSKSFFDNLGDKVIHDIFVMDVNLVVE